MHINNTQQTPFQFNLVIHFPDRKLYSTANARKCAEASGKIAKGMMGYSFDLDDTRILVCDKSTEISLKVKETFKKLKEARELREKKIKENLWSRSLEDNIASAKRAFEEAKQLVAGHKTETETIEYTD